MRDGASQCVMLPDCVLAAVLPPYARIAGIRCSDAGVLESVIGYSAVPLALHRTYTRRQLFAAFGSESIWRTIPQSGVAWILEHGAYIMLVTLEKDADSFTERTRYRKYAISPTVATECASLRRRTASARCGSSCAAPPRTSRS